MLILICLLVIIPAVLGKFIKSMTKPDGPETSFFFALGFFVMIGEFALICYPAVYFDLSFHLVCIIISSVYLIECLIILTWLVKSGQFTPKIRFSKERFTAWTRSPAFWIMLALCGFQIIRLFAAQPFEIRDSKSYNVLISDILQSDHLFAINPVNGTPINSMLDIPIKFFLSPWYPFIAMLAKVSRVHFLIIINTILPGYILFLHYITIYSLGLYLFKNKKENACLFTALCAFLYEITMYCHTPTMIKLIWPVWGKGTLCMTIVPSILVLYLMYAESLPRKKSIWFPFLFIILVISGCSMSTMAALVLPMELGILGLIWSIQNHSVRPLANSIISSFPSVLYVAVYYLLSSVAI